MTDEKGYGKAARIRCVLCGAIEAGHGHNPEPIVGFDAGRCCTACNQQRVLPERLGRMVRALNPHGDRHEDHRMVRTVQEDPHGAGDQVPSEHQRPAGHLRPLRGGTRQRAQRALRETEREEGEDVKFANVPVCDECWGFLNEARPPVRLRNPDKEHCHYCHRPTRSGIYVRANVE